MRVSCLGAQALVGVPRLPNHLRGHVISQLHVLARLRGEVHLELATPEQLTAYLQGECGGLLPRLHAEWYNDAADGALRAPYAPPGRQPKASKAKK